MPLQPLALVLVRVAVVVHLVVGVEVDGQAGLVAGVAVLADLAAVRLREAVLAVVGPSEGTSNRVFDLILHTLSKPCYMEN